MLIAENSARNAIPIANIVFPPLRDRRGADAPGRGPADAPAACCDGPTINVVYVHHTLTDRRNTMDQPDE
jgi:hypothetical protein